MKCKLTVLLKILKYIYIFLQKVLSYLEYWDKFSF